MIGAQSPSPAGLHAGHLQGGDAEPAKEEGKSEAKASASSSSKIPPGAGDIAISLDEGTTVTPARRTGTRQVARPHNTRSASTGDSLQPPGRDRKHSDDRETRHAPHPPTEAGADLVPATPAVVNESMRQPNFHALVISARKDKKYPLDLGDDIFRTATGAGTDPASDSEHSDAGTSRPVRDRPDGKHAGGGGDGRAFHEVLHLTTHAARARLAECQQLAARRVELREQSPDYLNRLYRAYRAHTPRHVQSDHERTLEAVANLVDHSIAPEQVSQAVFWGRLRDFLSQFAASETGYLCSWFLAGYAGIQLTEQDKDELAKILFPSLIASGGLLIATRLLRKGDLYPTWTRPYSYDDDRGALVGTLDGWNFVRATAAYWGFVPTLVLITRYVTPSEEIADPAERKKALAIALTSARMRFNVISSALVACHRYFMLPREVVFLDARDPPDTPHDRKGETGRAMIGAIRELSAPKGSTFPGVVALRKTIAASLTYLKHVGIGAGRMLLIDAACDAARTRAAGQPVAFDYSGDSATRDISRLSLLLSTALVLHLTRSWGGHPGEDTPVWNDVLDMGALWLMWGVATALADRLNLQNQSVNDDIAYNNSTRRVRLARDVQAPVRAVHVAPPPGPAVPPRRDADPVRLFLSPVRNTQAAAGHPPPRQGPQGDDHV